MWEGERVGRVGEDGGGEGVVGWERVRGWERGGSAVPCVNHLNRPLCFVFLQVDVWTSYFMTLVHSLRV